MMAGGIGLHPGIIVFIALFLILVGLVLGITILRGFDLMPTWAECLRRLRQSICCQASTPSSRSRV
jgi:hypothetical protein